MNFKNFEKVFKNFSTNALHYFCFAFAAVILCSQNANAQEEVDLNGMPPPQLRLEYSAGEISANSMLKATITIPEKWHVNANIAADAFLKPSSIKAEAEGITFAEAKWPEPKKQYSEALDFENLIFEGTFEVVIPVASVAEQYDSLSTTATFYYQACSNICLAPDSVKVQIGKGLFLNSKTDPSGAAPAEKKSPGIGDMLKPIKKNVEESNIENSSAETITTSEVTEQKTGSSSTSTAMLLFFAFIGGMILNLMPCVLPVLSLKLFSLIKQAGESRSRLFTLGVSTATGILASFWILAGVISLVQMGGGNAGWGMQFQSAGFIAFMVVLLTVFAMSFFGTFEVWLPGSAMTKMDGASRKQGVAGAFFTGALLVLLSTPCSAPFLGTAMGFAFTASTPVLFLFFTSAAFGLALPYLLVSAFPKILSMFPKPGPWMVKLQKVMGVLLLATVAWLLWIVSEQAGSAGVVLFAVLAVLSIVAAVAIGKIAPPGKSFALEIGAFAVSAVVIAGLWFLAIAPQYKIALDEQFAQKANIVQDENGWYNFTPALLEKFEKENRTVFIDVTADWCITCKANETAVLSSKELLQKMDDAGVARVRADWTRESPEVNAILKNLGKSGVPAYGVYPKGKASDVIVLSEILTSASILEAIAKAR